MSKQHRDLIIILSVVLGVVGLLVIAAALLLVFRSRGSSPFRPRGATPIADEEIRSWRASGPEPKPGHAPSSSDPRSIITRDVSIDSVAFGRPTPWSPRVPPPAMVHPNLPPSALGRAPNAREGLTDDAVPGAAAFVPAPKRQSTRLAKSPPGSAPSKSRRSSMSAKSARSSARIITWYDPDVPCPCPEGQDLKTVGGLSPRPKSQLRWEKEEDIGRAIS